MKPELREGIELFNQKKFFEAHEVIEEIWLRASQPEKNLLKGLIQAAAAFHHIRNQNSAGAKGLLLTSIKYLKEYESAQVGFEIQKLINDLEWQLKELNSNPAPLLEFPEIKITN